MILDDDVCFNVKYSSFVTCTCTECVNSVWFGQNFLWKTPQACEPYYSGYTARQEKNYERNLHKNFVLNLLRPS